MKNLKNIVGWISIALIVMIAISTIVVRFMFPELIIAAEQSFLKTWWIFIPLAFCVVGFSWGFESN